MTRYQFQHDTPFKFHKFFWYVTLPLSTLFFQEKPQAVFKSSGVGARLPEQR